MNRDDDSVLVSRREFVRLASIAAGLFALPACSDDEPSQEPADAEVEADLGVDDSDASELDAGYDGDAGPAFDLPSLGGAPDTPDGRAVAAFVDTIIPGAHRDPTGAPGAIDVDAAGMFFDPELPAAPFVPVLVLALDGWSRANFDGRLFTELTPEERESVVEGVLEAADLMGFAIQLAKLAYYSSRAAADHLGYPGPNPGYVDHEDFSFGRAMATEMTQDGNLN